MLLGQPGKWIWGILLLRHPESRVGADQSVFEGDGKSSPWEKPWGGKVNVGQGDGELGGSINGK